MLGESGSMFESRSFKPVLRGGAEAGAAAHERGACDLPWTLEPPPTMLFYNRRRGDYPMLRLTFGGLLVSGILAFNSQAQAYRCGPFDIWESNTYCVSCVARTFKYENCPGGEAGRVAVEVLFPGCSASYDHPGCNATPFSSREEVQTLMDRLKGTRNLTPLPLSQPQ